MRVQVVMLHIIWVIILAVCVQKTVTVPFGGFRKSPNRTNSCTLDSECSHAQICCTGSCVDTRNSNCHFSTPDGTSFGVVLGLLILICLIFAIVWVVRTYRRRAPYDRLGHQNPPNVAAAEVNFVEVEQRPPHQRGVPPSYHEKEVTPNPPPLYEERLRAFPPPSYSTGSIKADEPPPPYKEPNY